MDKEQGLQLQRLTGHVLDDVDGSRRSAAEPCVAYILKGTFCRTFNRLKLPMFIPCEQQSMGPDSRTKLIKKAQNNEDRLTEPGLKATVP